MGGCKSLGSKIILLIHTSALWGQYLVFSHPEFSRCSFWGVAAVWYLLDGRYSFRPELPWGSLDHHPWGLQSLMAVTSFVYWYSTKVFISQYLFIYLNATFSLENYFLPFQTFYSHELNRLWSPCQVWKPVLSSLWSTDDLSGPSFSLKKLS